MSNENKKFTATLVTEEDKATIVSLREQTGLAEKQLMSLVIKHTNVSAIQAEAVGIVEQEEKDRTDRRLASYEALKAKMKADREAAKAAKPAKAPKAPKAPKATAATAAAV